MFSWRLWGFNDNTRFHVFYKSFEILSELRWCWMLRISSHETIWSWPVSSSVRLYLTEYGLMQYCCNHQMELTNTPVELIGWCESGIGHLLFHFAYSVNFNVWSIGFLDLFNSGFVTFTLFDAPEITDPVMSLLISGWWITKRLHNYLCLACNAPHCSICMLISELEVNFSL